MSRLIFINLLIDDNWDQENVLKSIFPIRLQSSDSIYDTYLQWGIFEGGNNDYVLVKQKLDHSFKSFLENFIEIPKEVTFDEINEDFMKKIDSFLFSGVSSVEERILNHKNEMYGFLPASSYIDLNSKDLLVKIASIKHFRFPKTEIIKLEEFEALEKSTLPYVLKYPISAGGQGVFIINERNKHIPGYIKRQLENNHPNTTFLKQEYLNATENFYTFSDTDNFENTGGFRIIYDKHNNSRVHIAEKNLNNERISAVKIIAEYLRSINYHGPFGFDGITDDKNNIFPAIDLNVRFDKSRLISNLSKKLGVARYYFEFRRERFSGMTFKDFDSFWFQREKNLMEINAYHSNSFFFIPVLFANFFQFPSEQNVMEINFFIGAYKEFDHDDFYVWLEKIYGWIGATLEKN